MHIRFSFAALAAIAVLSAGCSDDENLPVIPQTHYNIALEATPSTVTLTEDDSVLFDVVARDVDTDLPIPHPDLSIELADTNITLVEDEDGNTWLHAVGPNSSSVTVSLENVHADSVVTTTVPVTITPVPAGSVVIDSVLFDSLVINDSTSIWKPVDPSAPLAMYSDSVNGGQWLALHASVANTTGEPLPARLRHWTVLGNVLDTTVVDGDTTIARVVELSGDTVTALRPGTVTVVASVDGVDGAPVADSVEIQVTSLPVDSVDVKVPATAPDTLAVGGMVQLTAIPLSADGKKLTDRVVQWTSDNQAIAVVSKSGAVTATGAGTATITATAEGKSSSVTVIVK